MVLRKLNWKYCECGCHCHEVTVGGSYYSIYNDLQGAYLLSQNNDPRYSQYAKKFGSFAEADKAAYKMALEELESAKKALEIKGNNHGDSAVSARI